MREKIIEMAREAGLVMHDYEHPSLERFAELVRKDYSTTHANIWLDRIHKFMRNEREKVARWMMEQGYATGHGDSIEDLLEELEWQIKEKTHE